MPKPRLLDLFCGAGGVAMGYHRAGFEVVGVDIKPQPHYPFEFHQAEAFTYPLDGFDAYHASPPCQGYSVMHNLPWLKENEYPLLLPEVLRILEATGKPYVIENVMGARYGARGLTKRGLAAHGLKAGWLCGTMFGLPFYRHRLFATNFLWLAPGHPKHTRANGKVEKVTKTGTTEPGYGLTQWHNGAQASGCGIGHARGWRLATVAMGIDWMTRDELTQAIPPAYTEFIGRLLIAEVERGTNLPL